MPTNSFYRGPFFTFSTLSNKRKLVVAFSVTAGVVPTAEELKSVLAQGTLPDEIKAIYDKMKPFTTPLKDVSVKTAKDYSINLEENAKAMVTYAKDQYIALYPKIPTAIVNDMFDTTKLGGTGSTALKSLPKLASLLSRGNTRGFWDAAMARVQVQRDLNQQVSNTVGMSVEHFKEAQTSLRTLSAGYAYSAKVTNSANYIANTSKAQKLEDSKAFSDWVKDNSNHFADVIRLNLSDMPFSYASAELISFENDQQNDTKKALVVAKLHELQKEAYDHIVAELKKNPATKVDVYKWVSEK